MVSGRNRTYHGTEPCFVSRSLNNQVNWKVYSSKTVQGTAIFFQELKNVPKFKTPFAEKRRCTDVVCLVLFVAFMTCWSFVAVLAFRSGDLKRILYPSDSMVSFQKFQMFSWFPYISVNLPSINWMSWHFKKPVYGQIGQVYFRLE